MGEACIAGGLAAGRCCPGRSGCGRGGAILGRSWNDPRTLSGGSGMPARCTLHHLQPKPTPVLPHISPFPPIVELFPPPTPAPPSLPLVFSQPRLPACSPRPHHTRPQPEPLAPTRSHSTRTHLFYARLSRGPSQRSSALHAHRELLPVLSWAATKPWPSPPNLPRIATSGHNTGPGTPQRVSTTQITRLSRQIITPTHPN